MKENHQNPHAIGIDNCRKRLELLYPNRFVLLTKEENGYFKTYLNIQLRWKSWLVSLLTTNRLHCSSSASFANEKADWNLLLSANRWRAEGNSPVQTWSGLSGYWNEQHQRIGYCPCTSSRELSHLYDSPCTVCTGRLDLDAVDFLHKPFAYERFEKAVEKAIVFIEARQNNYRKTS